MGNYDAEAQAAAGKLCTPALPRSATGMLNLTRLDNKVLFGGETTIAYLAQDARHDLLSKAKRSKSEKSLGKLVCSWSGSRRTTTGPTSTSPSR